jgi:hypothetical protein
MPAQACHVQGAQGEPSVPSMCPACAQRSERKLLARACSRIQRDWAGFQREWNAKVPLGKHRRLKERHKKRGRPHDALAFDPPLEYLFFRFIPAHAGAVVVSRPFSMRLGGGGGHVLKAPG